MNFLIISGLTFCCILTQAKLRPDTQRDLVKIKMSEAISIAQSKTKARFFESALETKNNIAIYRVSFFQPDKKTYEIEVDAKTGKILKMDDESTAN